MIPNELVTSVFFALLFFIFYKKTKNNAFIFLSIFPLILLSFSILFDWGIVLPSFNYFIYIFSGTLIFIFFNWIIKLDNYKIVFISISTALLMQLLFFGILNGRFINSFKTLFNEGFTAKTNYYLLAKQKYSSLDIEISKYLNNKELNNKKGYFLLIPPTLGSYSDPSFYGMSLFFSHNNMISTVWNRNQYQITFDKLVNLYGEDIVNNYYNTFLETKSTWQNYFIYYYNNIDLNKLKKLYNNYNIRYFILDNDFAEIKNILVYKSDKNSLYDLSLIQ